MSFPIENIQKLCDSTGETFKSLEKRFGFSNSSIKRWGTAKKLPPYNRVKMIADYFNVSINDLSNGLYDDRHIDEKNPATESDGRNEVLNYIIDSVKDFSFEDQLQVASVVRSLKQYILTQDNQKESD